MTSSKDIRSLFLVIIGLLMITTLQAQIYATAGNPKTPEREIMAETIDPNPTLQQLAMGGVCALDDNIKALQEELDSEFSDAMIDELRNSTYDALNDTAAFINANDPVEPVTLGNPEDC